VRCSGSGFVACLDLWRGCWFSCYTGLACVHGRQACGRKLRSWIQNRRLRVFVRLRIYERSVWSCKSE
jgi:hypothetical protein